jgi:hypothetical protein
MSPFSHSLIVVSAWVIFFFKCVNGFQIQSMKYSSLYNKEIIKQAIAHSTFRRGSQWRYTETHLRVSVSAIDQHSVANDFGRWAAERGIYAPNIEPADFDGLRGIKSRTPICAGEILVEFPLSSAMFVGDAQQCPIPGWVDARFWYIASLHARLAVLLLLEVSKGASSDYYPWIRAMPTDHSDKLARWSDAELLELQDPALAREAQQQRAIIDAAYGDLSRLSPATPITLDAFRWFAPPSHAALLPNAGSVGRAEPWSP